MRSQKFDFAGHVCWLCRPFNGKPRLDQWHALLDQLRGLHEQVMNHPASVQVQLPRLRGEAGCPLFTRDWERVAVEVLADVEPAGNAIHFDVYRNGKKITQLAPEKRFYNASQQVQTMVANHSTLAWDLYVIYAGQNPDNGHPIIKVFLNPLVAWIWIGVLIVVAGTLVALAPSLTTVLDPARAKQPAKAATPSLVSEPATMRGAD